MLNAVLGKIKVRKKNFVLVPMNLVLEFVCVYVRGVRVCVCVCVCVHVCMCVRMLELTVI